MSQPGPVALHACRRRFFECEVERLLDRLYGTAVRLTRSETEAEDLVAEALTKAWARLDDLQDLQAFEKWVFTILANTFVSDRRRARARPREWIIDAESDADAEHFSLFDQVHQPFLLWWGNPEQKLLDKLLREDIERAFQELPEAFRVVVTLVEVQGFSYEEAAQMLGIPVGTVRSRLNRGRSTLQKALWRQASEFGVTSGRSGGAAQ